MFSVDEIYLPGQELVKIPPLIRIRQKVADDSLADNEIIGTLREQLKQSNLDEKLRPGDAVAIGVGSRGISSLLLVLRELICHLKVMGCEPFIVPAMGSHGGGTALGQEKILSSYGITEKELGVPIKASMEVSCLGYTSDGVPVYCDRFALGAQGIIVVNRIKVHTGFGGDIESGLMKMIAIGLGKHRGAVALHSLGLENLCFNIREVARVAMNRAPIMLGVGLVENNFKRLCNVSVLKPQELEDREKELLVFQKSSMLKLPFDEADILIDEVGKDISGAGLDNNVIGRFKTNMPKIRFIVSLRLTKASMGNAVGIGVSDFVPMSFLQSIDFQVTYTNLLTAGTPEDAKLPVVLKDDRTVITIAVMLCHKRPQDLKLARIKNTADLRELRVSEALFRGLRQDGSAEALGDFEDMQFDNDGVLL